MIQSIFSQSELDELEDIFKSPKKNFQEFISLIDGRFESYNRKLTQNIEKYQYIIENALEGVWIIDSENITIYVNTSMANILGYSIEEMIGKSVFHFMNKKSEKETRIHIEDRKKGISAVRESQMIHKEGKSVYLRMKATPIFNDEGEYEGTFAFISDITEKKESEQKLKESEELYKTLVKTSPDAITVSDLKGNIIELSERALEMNGFTLEEMIGKSAFELIAPEDHKRAIENIQKTLKDGKVSGVEYNLLRKDGSTFIGELNASIVKGIKGRPKAFISTVRDITERKKAEEKLIESEEKYRNLINNLGNIVIEMDLKGKFKYVSPQVKDILGFHPDEVIGTNGFSYIHPEDVKNAAKTLKAALTNKEKTIIEYRTLNKEGDYVYVSAGGRVVKGNGKGKVIAVVEDITERKLAEQKIKESEEKFRTIAEQTMIGIMIFQKKSIIYVNNALSKITGYQFEDLKNWTYDKFIEVAHKDDLPLVYKKLYERSVGKVNNMFNFSCRLISKQGDIKWVNATSKLIKYQEKQASLVSIVDITDQKEAEENLKRINKLKTELLRRTSHELKTPLVSIKGFTNLLLEVYNEELHQDLKAIINEIRNGSERLENLIMDILETSKLESGKVALKKSKEDLSLLIKFTVNSLKKLAELRQQTINVRIYDKLETKFEKEKIREVLENLISNSIKYTPPYGKIEINSEIKEKFYIISIRDDGIGFTEEEKKDLFTQFGKIERFGQGWDLDVEGSGLGLYISKEIIKLHGGEIWLESEGRDKGSTFYFSLPIIT